MFSALERAHPNNKLSPEQAWLVLQQKKVEPRHLKKQICGLGSKISGPSPGPTCSFHTTLNLCWPTLGSSSLHLKEFRTWSGRSCHWSAIDDHCWLIPGCSQEGKVHHPTRSSKAHSVLSLNSGKAATALATDLKNIFPLFHHHRKH